MSENRYTFSVFTKPWKMPLPELGKHVADLGFEGVELPVRPGFQVEPENVKELPEAAKALGEFGVRICSVAGPTDEATMAACAEAGVPVIRICPIIEEEETYLEGEARLIKEYEAMVPLLERYGVTLGLQNHCGRYVANAMHLRRILDHFEPKHVAAVWDAAHNALDGEQLDLALDIVESHLCIVNLKNAILRRANGPEAEYAEWQSYWTSGRHGLASWPQVAAELKKRGWYGVICVTAEYSDHDAVDRLIAEDIAFAKSLFEAAWPT